MSSSYLSGRSCRVVKNQIVAYEGTVEEKYSGIWCDLLRTENGDYRVLVLTENSGLKIERLQDVFID